MSCRRTSILLFILCLLAACSTPTPAPTWRTRITVLVDELSRQDAPRLYPQEYQNIVETFEHGEAVLHVQGNDREADKYYLLAMQKGDLLKAELLRLRELQAEQQRKRLAEQAARAEEERLMRKAAEAEARLREQERIRAEEAAKAAAKNAIASKEISIPQPLSYTVRRGETLPQIAARNEIYNDASLWPLIYRANRDQIRDPKQLWPGQVLVIPRHFTRDAAMEAKRYSGRK